MNTRVKICGLTRLDDALFAIASDADYLGFILVKKSPRYIDVSSVREIIRKLPPQTKTVGVFVNEKAADVVSVLAETGLTIAQLHGHESENNAQIIGVNRVWKACSITSEEAINEVLDFPADQLLIDTTYRGQSGGTGKTGNWILAKKLDRQRNVMLACGLTPDNVRAAIEQVQPFVVDVSSGVESSPGIKDHTLIQSFIHNAKGKN